MCHVCVYVCVYVCMCVRVRVCLIWSVCMCVYVCVHVCVRVDTFALQPLRTQLSPVCVRACVCVWGGADECVSE